MIGPCMEDFRNADEDHKYCSRCDHWEFPSLNTCTHCGYKQLKTKRTLRRLWQQGKLRMQRDLCSTGLMLETI